MPTGLSFFFNSPSFKRLALDKKANDFLPALGKEDDLFPTGSDRLIMELDFASTDQSRLQQFHWRLFELTTVDGALTVFADSGLAGTSDFMHVTSLHWVGDRCRITMVRSSFSPFFSKSNQSASRLFASDEPITGPCGFCFSKTESGAETPSRSCRKIVCDFFSVG